MVCIGISACSDVEEEKNAVAVPGSGMVDEEAAAAVSFERESSEL